MKQFAFVCGGATASDLTSADQVIRLNVAGPDMNVNLRLADVSRALLSDLPDLLVDLLELAAYVYCADQRASRGDEQLARAGSAWRRHLRFIIPVRCPEIWSSAAVRDLLESTLGYLSDDHYEFHFVGAEPSNAEGQIYFTDLIEGSGFKPDNIILFSGGVDSLTGVVEELANGKRVVLVGHHSAPKVVNVQKELVADLRRRGFREKMFHVTVNVTNSGVEAIESTQRTRSFLFASLAFVIARLFDLDQFTFYENGVVSLNLPIAADVLGARATRTTHPKVVRGFERLFSQLAARKITIATPYLWLTKKEVVERLVAKGHPDLLAKSVSCVHPILWTKAIRHCGGCSQCIDRRFAVLAADAEEHDVRDGYGIDLLTGDRRHQAPDPATAYVKFARSIASLGSDRFQSEFPQVSSALHQIPGASAREVLGAIWDLHRRHAAGVLSVLGNATRQYSDDLVHGRLAPGSLLNLCFARDRVEMPGPDTTVQMAAFIDRLSAPVCDFAVDEISDKICFKGGYSVNGTGYKLLRALIDRHREAKKRDTEVEFFWTAKLATAIGVDEPALRQHITRLRKEVEQRLAVDQGVVLPAGFIENQKSKGYRLSPELREVSLADINRGSHK